MRIPDREFVGFPKISRWSRDVIVTEKIDGTNAQIVISDDGSEIFAASRKIWLTPEKDNAGFARWVEEHTDELKTLGPGAHFGEWWGKGIQRNYGLTEKRFSLFNVSRWGESRPACCSVVPELWRGNMNDLDADELIAKLINTGSIAAPGFMRPEGIVIFHVPSGTLFKKFVENDGKHKGEE